MTEHIELEQLTTVWGEFTEAEHNPGPSFGSLGWVELDADDPRRQAAIVRAAFAWWAAEHGVGAAPVAPGDHADASSAVAQALAEQRAARRRAAMAPCAAPFPYPPEALS